MKYKSLYKYPNEKDVTIGIYETREEAIKKCVEYKHDGSYCLDSKEDRIRCLELRNYCILGCGPGELSIEEVEA